MIPLINQNTFTQRIRAEYEALIDNADCPLELFEMRMRRIHLLSSKIYQMQRQHVMMLRNAE